jgi:hypothetical protein
MKNIKKGPWIAVSLMLMLWSRPGAAQSPAGQQDSSSRQRYAELLNMEVTPQNSTANETPVGSATQTAAPSQTAPPAQNQTQTQDKKDDQQPAAQQPGATQRPNGTAAAETDTAGVAASRPAGMAIAPAKQHRSRAFWVKMGAIAGAGVALGTTLGLSKATSSKPPNTH